MISLKDNNAQILHIAFFARPSRWIYRIINELNSKQKQRYSKSPLGDLSFSISRKMVLLRTCVTNTNLEMDEINRLLREEKQAVSQCIQARKAYLFSDIHHVYKVLAYVEATLTNIKSCFDFIIKYIKGFHKHILGEKLDNVIEELKDEGIDIDWKEDLRRIRNDLLHNYSAWIFFKKQNDTFKLVISLPEDIKKKGGYKQFPYDRFDTDEINFLLREFQKFFKEFPDFLLNRLREKSKDNELVEPDGSPRP